MNYDNYYKNGGMTKEESISAIALRIGARKEAVAKFVEENDIDTNKMNSDLKSGKVYFMDIITAIVGKPNNKYQKEIIKKYSSKMAMGGKTQGYDDREDERLGMDYGKIAGKDFVGSHSRMEHSRRDDARFEERMARGGKIDEKEKLSNISYQLINTTESFKKNNPEAYSRMKDEYKAQFIKVYGKDEYAKRHIMADGGMMARGGKIDTILNNEQLKMLQYINLRNKDGEDEEKYIIMFFEDKKLLSRFDVENYKDDLINLGYLADVEDKLLVTSAGEEYLKKYGNKMAMGGELTYDDFKVDDFYSNSSEGGKFKFVGKDESGRLRFEDSKGIIRIFSPKRMNKYADGGMMARGGYMSKGELVWKKLRKSERMKFLHENFTPQITPRSQETLVGKDYNFLPKNVKIIMESKYANVEDYADGGMMAEGGEVYYVRDFYPNYDEDKIVSILKSNGLRKVRKAKLYGMSNLPQVAVFEGDKSKAQEILEKEFPDNYISIYEKDWGRKMADGGETERDTNGMLYALQEHVSSGEIASKTNASKYSDIDEIRSKAIQYYMENGDKPYSYAELESVLKKFDHTKYADGRETERKAEALKTAVEIATMAYNNGVRASDMSFEDFSDRIFGLSNTSYPIVDLRLAYQSMKNANYAEGGYIDEDGLHELARLVMDSIDYTVNISLDEFIKEVSMTGYQRELCMYVLNMFNEYENPKPRLGEVEEFRLVREGMFEYIKNYYLNEYPTDDLGADINPKADFDGLLMVLNEGDDVYEYLGVTDSLVRERVFEKLANIMGVEYNVIYDMWLSSDDKFKQGGIMANGGKIAKDDVKDKIYFMYQKFKLGMGDVFATILPENPNGGKIKYGLHIRDVVNNPSRTQKYNTQIFELDSPYYPDSNGGIRYAQNHPYDVYKFKAIGMGNHLLVVELPSKGRRGLSDLIYDILYKQKNYDINNINNQDKNILPKDYPNFFLNDLFVFKGDMFNLMRLMDRIESEFKYKGNKLYKDKTPYKMTIIWNIPELRDYNNKITTPATYIPIVEIENELEGNSKKFEVGGAIENQYEGRTPEDIWDSLDRDQRYHFIDDHALQIEMLQDKNYDFNSDKFPESISNDLVKKSMRSDWKDLDETIQNRFANHVRTGEYAKGGEIRSQKEFNNLVEEKRRLVKNLSPKEVAEMWNRNTIGSPNRMTEEEAKMSKAKIYLSDLLVEKELTEAEYNQYFAKGGMMADGGAIENQYEGRTAKDIWESWNHEQKIHFFIDHKEHTYYNMGGKEFVVSKNDREKYVGMSYDDLPKTVRLMISDHVEEGQYANGGEIGSMITYKGRKTKILDAYKDKAFGDRMVYKVNTPLYENIKNSPMTKTIITQDENGEYRKIERSDYVDKMAKGGEISEQNKINKKVLALVQKANIDSKLEFGQLVVSALTDANAHSEVRKFISIIEKKPEWAEKPKEIDMKLPREEYEKQRAKTVYSSKYYDANEEINDLGIKIANMFGWDFEGILDSLIFASKMSGRNDVAEVLEKLNTDDDKQDATKNKWDYTDVDDIEYVVVKDKSGKELRFAGKHVLSGVHDLLEKGGKLSEKGKYYSKDNVVSVVVGGKNIIDKNTVSGVWIMKDAKPIADDVADMKIGKTTIRKGFNGWVGKTMVDNFKGFDWDITTIKTSRGDLVTTAQGGKSQDNNGYKSFSFMLFQDPNIRLKVSRPARVTDKVVSAQHEEALKEFKERQEEIAEMVDQIQAKKKMADGGAIGFDALAKKVAKNYEGDKVKKQYQDEYGKTYDKKEAEEVGKKVAAKVYRQQKAKGKMAKGGETSNYRTNSKLARISAKAKEIRKANEPWRDAFKRAKAMIG